MADRQVTQTGKDADGDITKLCNPGSDWSPRSKASAIQDIENNVHTYFVWSGARRSDIEVVDGPTGKYLRSKADGSASNNLDNLPDC